VRVEGGSALGEEDPGRAAGVLEEADKHGGVDLGGGRTRAFRGDGVGGCGRGAY